MFTQMPPGVRTVVVADAVLSFWLASVGVTDAVGVTVPVELGAVVVMVIGEAVAPAAMGAMLHATTCPLRLHPGADWNVSAPASVALTATPLAGALPALETVSVYASVPPVWTSP